MASAPPQPAEWLPVLLMTAGLVVLGVLLTATIRNRIARRRSAAADPREMIDRLKRDAARHDDFAEAEVRYLETTRRLAAQLDNKACMLEQLIADADERIAALRAAAAAPGAPGPPPPVPAVAGPADEPDALTRTVYALADQGRGATAIARELEEPIGTVELILALRASGAGG